MFRTTQAALLFCTLAIPSLAAAQTADLDGDGAEESYAVSDGSIEIDGTAFEADVWEPFEAAEVVDFDTTDGRQELHVWWYGDSDGIENRIFFVEDGALVTWTFAGQATLNGDGTILTRWHASHYQATELYAVGASGTLEATPQPYRYVGTAWTVVGPVTISADAAGAQPTLALDAGDTLTILLEPDSYGAFLVVTGDGIVGWIQRNVCGDVLEGEYGPYTEAG